MTQTKKFKQVFCFLLALTMIVSMFQVNGKAANVNAATKYYTIEAYNNVKIGKYTYRFNENKNVLQRKKTGTSKYTTILKNVYGKCIATSSKIYYITYSGNYSILYQCNMNGKSKKKIAKSKMSFELGAIYNNKFYVSTGGEEAGYTTYTISKSGKIKKEKSQLRIYRGGSNQYMVGSIAEPTDVSASSLCIYNAKTKKKIKLGDGKAPRIINKKVYYASFNNSTNRYIIKSCDLNGKNKKTITTLPETISVAYVCDKYAMYTAWDDNGNYVVKKKSY